MFNTDIAAAKKLSDLKKYELEMTKLELKMQKKHELEMKKQELEMQKKNELEMKKQELEMKKNEVDLQTQMELVHLEGDRDKAVMRANAE